MESLYSETRKDLNTLFEELKQYEETESVHRVEDDFTQEGNILLQTRSYNVIVTPDSIQIKGVEATRTEFMDLEQGEKQAFEYLKQHYSSPSATRNGL